jgi:imidazolonepropionase-like amidohydrolase
MRNTLFAVPLLVASAASAQAPAELSQAVRQYVSVEAPVVALTNVTVIDGTGAPARERQTIVIQDGKVAALGARVSVPAGARVIDLPEHTVIPGMVGLHDHLFYTAVGGRRVDLSYSAPRLYLGSGVTTIRTTGSNSPYSDINLKHEIAGGRQPGPTIFITAPYITGAGGSRTMAHVTTPEEARRFVAYWAEEGASWIKAYTDIHRSELAAAIDEAHARGLRVTGHLCSVTFEEAVALGIDNLEHGLLTASDFAPEKEADECPNNVMVVAAHNADPAGPEAARVIRTLIDNGVGMTSTLAVYEPFFPNRDVTDQRTLEAMAPEIREAYLEYRAQIDSATNYPLTREMLAKAMAFEKRFFDEGGILAAGVDPTGSGGALPGFGDQRNYELFIEAGFTPEQAVQVLTLNGARILGHADRIGSVEAGKSADIVVIRGDLRRGASTIRNVTLVFKDGIGFDPAKLIESVKGRVGIS